MGDGNCSVHSSLRSALDETSPLLLSGQGSIQRSFRYSGSTKDSDADYIHVEIPVMKERDSRLFHSTTIALHKCEKTVLKPYLILLALLGWRPLSTATSCARRTFNLLYLLLIVGCIVTSYVIKVIVCEKSSSIVAPTISPFKDMMSTVEKSSYSSNHTHSHCPHIFSLFIVPESVHFLAYVYLFYHYRIRETEQLSSLIETVFLQTTNSPSSVCNAAQRRLILTLRAYLVAGLVWVSFTITTEIVHYISTANVGAGNDGGVLAVELIGHLIINAVFAAIVINYVTQCQLLICYVRAVLLSMAERSVDMNTLMKNIYGLKQFVSRLNKQIATATSACIFVFAELMVVGFANLIWKTHSNRSSVWIHKSMLSMQWLVVLSAVVIQACRLSELLVKLRYSGLSVRVFGYRTSAQVDLDSFLEFVTASKMEAKLFSFPVRLKYIIGLVALVSFVFLILFQFDSSFARSVSV